MKRIIILFVTSMVAISLTGCSSNELNVNSDNQVDLMNVENKKEGEAVIENFNYNDQEMSPTEKAYYKKQEKEYASVMEKISNEPINKAVAKTFSTERLLDIYLWDSYDPLNSRTTAPTTINMEFEIELLRKTNNDRIYSIQKTDGGGLFYSFFVGENGGCLYNSIYVVKSLEMKDMSSLKIGDDISIVERIDPAASQHKRMAEKYVLNNFNSKHLLKDGLLVINYENKENSYIITDIQYHADFKIVKTYDIYAGEEQDDVVIKVEYDYSILSMDYPE